MQVGMDGIRHRFDVEQCHGWRHKLNGWKWEELPRHGFDFILQARNVAGFAFHSAAHNSIFLRYELSVMEMNVRLKGVEILLLLPTDK